MMDTKLKNVFAALLLAIALIQLMSMVIADPAIPDSATIISVQRKLNSSLISGTVDAIAGNVTEINIRADVVTKSWQGYYGNVTGDIVLDDQLNWSIYIWDLVDPLGEVYASRNNTINWTGGNIICANNTNYTEHPDPLNTHIAREELDMAMNAESAANIQARDGVNETFNITTHPAFNVSNNGFSANSCPHTAHMFMNDTKEADGSGRWNETLIWAESDDALIYMAYINPNAWGFNNKSYDFQMIVAEDGHMDNTTSTLYYLWVELE